MRQAYVVSDLVMKQQLADNLNVLEEKKSRLMRKLHNNGIFEPDYQIEYHEGQKTDGTLLFCYTAIPHEMTT